jgi:serine/threonine protein phosphatase PrpC
MHAFVSEKIEGSGEDATPIAMINESCPAAALGVFDGLGGSGARLVKTEGRTRSSAAEASALAADVTRRVLASHGFRSDRSPPAEPNGSISARGIFQELAIALTHEFRRAAHEFTGDKPPLVRGTISKRLPTTACLMIAEAVTVSKLRITSAWAGDSRGYLFSACDGLQQLTRDHTRVPVDALSAITEDPPMSNLVSADQPVRFEVSTVEVGSPCLFFCATDGAFNYLPSPIELEAEILRSFTRSSSWDFAANKVFETLVRVAEDDASLALCGYGWEWGQLLCDAENRLRTIEPWLESISAARAAARVATEAAAEAAEQRAARLRELQSVVSSIWQRYRGSHEALLVNLPETEQERT